MKIEKMQGMNPMVLSEPRADSLETITLQSVKNIARD